MRWGWNSLSYVGNSSFKYGLYTLSANQTDHIQFDTLVAGSLNAPSTGSGQENGIITLAAGKTYKLTLTSAFYFTTTAANSVVIQAYNRTSSDYFGLPISPRNSASSAYGSYPTILIAFISPTVSTDIDIRFTSVTNLNYIYSSYTQLLIEEYGGY